jgi:hypothetical protein
MNRSWTIKKEVFHEIHDQITSCSCPSGTQYWQCGYACLLRAVFSKSIHSTTTICNPCSKAVSQDRLPRHNPNASRLFRPAPRSQTEEGTSLLHSLLRRATVAKKRAFDSLLRACLQRATEISLIDERPEVAIDATGLETRHVSSYYVQRVGYRQFRRRRWPKLTMVCHTRTHLIVGAVVTKGPSQDSPQFPNAVTQAAKYLSIDRLLGDAGYDGEHNHQLCRDELGIRSTVIALNKRRTGRKWPKTKYRRQMKRRFHKNIYKNRAQVESAISRNKRLLGSALRAKTDPAQERECCLRVVTHNLMILRLCA